MNPLVKFVRASKLMRLTPKPLKRWAKARLGFAAINQADWETNYQSILRRARPGPAETDQRVCIIKDWMLRHAYYEAACLELGVPYTILDFTTADWVEKFANDASFVYLLRPFVLATLWRTVYEERAFMLARVMQKNLFPNFEELWMYESKRRCASLLQYHGIPHPRTWVFFSRAQAREFLATARYPLIFKTDLGSDAVGVRVLRDRAAGEQVVRVCFGRGFASGFYDPRDRNYGQVFFQEHLGEVREWRVIRIGDSYFAYEKGKQGQFHSGSKVVHFGEPPTGLLEFARQNLDKLGLTCIALDVFLDPAQRFFVNEIQTYYGANETGGIYFENGQPVQLEDNQTVEMMINGTAGRYFYNAGLWQFEVGDFSRNAGCNLRVKLAFQRRGCPLPGPRV